MSLSVMTIASPRLLRRLAGAACGAAALLAGTVAQAAIPIESWTASTGAKVFFVPSPSIPMLDVNIDFDAGSRYDPPGKSGLATLTAALLDKGANAQDGQPARNEAQIADAFADTGADFGGAAGGDRGGIGLRTLTASPGREQSLRLAGQLIKAPAYPDAVVAREKQRLITAIREGDTRPGVIADKTLSKAIYPTHPYGVSATPESVGSITRDDLLKFWRDNYTARRAVVTLIGAIDRKQAEQIAEDMTRGLPEGTAAPKLPDVQMTIPASEKRIPHPAQQASVAIGAPSIARGDPDYFALLVGNYVLGGGGFSSRLTDQVREKRGLTYGVDSYFAPSKQPGPFSITLQTKKENTNEALGLVRQILSQYVAQGPTDAELKAAKDNLVNGFPLRIDSNRKLLTNVANIGWYGLPLDYLDTWTAQINKVTRDQVRAAFQRHVQPDAMATVIVGGPEK
ncbi:MULTISPECIES: pitrilysin family protein [unclassified Cupriavidus]|uniref:M16 family metallopeptidase n=1 Tax=unclassified Cupriavidus TaxID=2640874 RepID=UPI001C006160|nr:MULTISPECIES: pitrilysin family protein [unclassified Cupriavidus]MCA3188186.1 insulinase family protein [Cupriavidus sp.]MCA3190410.1 insulinase family protein [Cupriavidus sp.]MCA3197114.1 insulinase family protein [Cupriavidus sp.]MCA3202391.1 insulinase family protein [Cupriavidus sp.]MCA3205859.1 insulinase family protein [Cupriavidus sp.]